MSPEKEALLLRWQACRRETERIRARHTRLRDEYVAADRDLTKSLQLEEELAKELEAMP